MDFVKGDCCVLCGNIVEEDQFNEPSRAAAVFKTGEVMRGEVYPADHNMDFVQLYREDREGNNILSIIPWSLLTRLDVYLGET